MKLFHIEEYGRTPDRQNSLYALKLSLDNGLGLETDIRDLNGELIISHDMPLYSNKNVTLNELLDTYCENGCDLTLALNIKSDGLCLLIKKKLQNMNIKNYFVFDMSVPDSLSYKNEGLNFLARQSEYEVEPAIYSDACGIWLDEFHTPWITSNLLKEHHQNGKYVAIVSPELHGRTYYAEWEKYKNISINEPDIKIILCTDHPLEAKNYFEK